MRRSSPLITLRDTLLPRALAPLAPGLLFRGPTHDSEGHPLLYLTVDDGPCPEGTPLWLETLDRHNAQAVFFLSGPPVERWPDLVTTLLDAGHRVGNHGNAHVSAWRMRPAALRDSMEAAEDRLDLLAGIPIRDVRPPYGRATPGLVRWCRSGQRRLVLWDLMPGDYLPWASAESVAAHVMRFARPGSIAVFHDGPPARLACEALDLALPRLASAGWRFPPFPAPC